MSAPSTALHSALSADELAAVAEWRARPRVRARWDDVEERWEDEQRRRDRIADAEAGLAEPSRAPEWLHKFPNEV